MTTWIRKTEKLFDGIYNNNLIIVGGMKMKAKENSGNGISSRHDTWVNRSANLCR